MNYELLADVAKVIMGQSPPSSTYNTVGEGLPFYQGKTDFGDMYPTPRVYCTEPSRIAEAGDILISVRAPVGPTNISQERSAIGRGLSVIRAGEKLDRDFLLYFLRFYEPELAKAGTGSTFAAIAREDLETIKIPLPPLTEQKRIASLLARADRLRHLRRTAHELGESLLQSVFLEMFGDVKLNQKGWDVFPLEDIVQPGRIITYGIVQAGPHIEDGIPYIRTGDIKEGQIVVDGLLRTSKEIAAKYKRSEVKAGELVMSIRATVGTIAELPPQLDGANLTQGTARISPGSKVNKKFLLYAISSHGAQKLIEDRVKGATFREITLEALREVPMIVPPLNLQEEFAGVAARVESLRGRMSEGERQVEGLFESMLAQSFGTE